MDILLTVIFAVLMIGAGIMFLSLAAIHWAIRPERRPDGSLR